MEEVNIEGKDVDLNSYSIIELKKLQNQINDKELEVKKEIDYILKKLDGE